MPDGARTATHLYGERLSLEPLSIEHAGEMVPVLADSSLYEFTGGEAPSETGLTARYGAQVAGSGNDAEVWLNWIVRELATEAAIGFIQADVTPDVSELAWVITPSRQCQGFAAEAASMAMHWLRGKGVRRFSAISTRTTSRRSGSRNGSAWRQLPSLTMTARSSGSGASPRARRVASSWPLGRR